MKISLELRKNDYYYILIDGRSEGKGRKYRSTGTRNKSDAEKVLRQVEKELIDNDFSDIDKIDFMIFYREWLNSYCKQNLRQSTVESYELVYRAHVKPYFSKNKVMLVKIKPLDIQRYYSSKLAQNLSPNTVWKHHANIRKCLDYARKMGIINSNPADNVELPKKVKFTGKFYDSKEVTILLDIIKNTSIELPVMLAVGLGLRRGEICGLRWEDVNLVTGKVHICNSRVEITSILEDEVKNQSSNRTLVLPNKIKEYLITLREKYPTIKYVCNHNNKPINPDYVSDKFAKVLNKSILPIIRFHDLRHTNASLLLNSGVDIKRIQCWLGHSKLSTTADIYSHLNEDYKQDTADVIDSLI